MSENSNTLPEGSIPLAGSMPLSQQPAALLSAAFQPAVPIDINLPNGLTVSMARPSISLSESVARVVSALQLQNPTIIELEKSRIKMLMYITHINGAPEPRIMDPIMRASLEQKLGDENLDALYIIWTEQFPQTDPGVLQIVKKS